MFALGCTAFLLFFLSDVNDCWLHRKPLRLAFPAGAAALATAVLGQCLRGVPAAAPAIRLGCCLLGALFLGLMVFSLFFALPAKSAYVEQGTGRPLNDCGVYALCRHPGVLFFIPAALCLWGAFGFRLYAAVTYSALNVLLILFEDAVVFPVVLAGYAEYQRTTPFLIPNMRSIRKCLEYYRKN